MSPLATFAVIFACSMLAGIFVILASIPGSC